MRDVAQVTLGAMPRQGAVTRDGKGESVAGMVIMLKGENGKTVAERVKARLAEIGASLPPGVTIAPFYDQTEVIDRTAHTVRKNLVEGSLLVIVVLFVFLGDVRAALIVAAVIPLSMLVGFIGMRYFGVSANLMSLGAIDFGLIVDGAVVMMENFVRRRGEYRPEAGVSEQDSRLALFTSAATEVARPILFGVLIIVAVYLPIFTLEGLEAKMFRPMAITVCSAILGSLVLSLTVVPVAASFLLKVGRRRARGAVVRAAARVLCPPPRRADEPPVAHARRVGGGGHRRASARSRSSAPSSCRSWTRARSSIETRKLPSVSLPESVAISTRVERVIGALPRSAPGRDEDRPARPGHRGDGHLPGGRLRHAPPADTWTSGRTKEELIDAMAEALEAVPGVEFNFTQPMAMRLDEVVSGVKADVAVKVFGPDAATLERLGEQVRRVLDGVPGAADLQVEVLSGAAQIEIVVNRAKMARYGLNVAHVRELVETAIGGATATEILDGSRRFDVVVRFPDEIRANPEAIAGLLLTAPGGERVTLGSVADVATVRGPEAINHENGERRLVVQTNVRGRDIGSFVAEAQRRLAAQVKLPEGYHLAWGGQFENQQRAMRRLTVAIPLSLAIIFLLLFVTFGNTRQAGLVILNVPFALVGGIGALWLRGLNLNLSASVGFIALFGVAVLNGVVMIGAVNRLREQGHGLRDAILTGAGTRLKPVLMTALVASLGFVPMALSTGAGSEIQRPLATVVIGGVVTSTLLTLIVLPTIYELIEAWMARRSATRRP